jgi:hypothetical protein
MVIIFDGRGLALLYANPEALNARLGFSVALIFIFYLLVTSLIVPSVAILVWDLLWQTFAFRLHKLDLPTLWRNGYVRLSEVSKEAHISKESYFLELEKEEKAKNEEEKHAHLYYLSFWCFALFAFDLFYDRASAATLVQHLYLASPDGRGLLYAIAVLIASFAALVWHFSKENYQFVYCPSLARKHVETLEKNEGEKREAWDRLKRGRVTGRSLSTPPDLP